MSRWPDYFITLRATACQGRLPREKVVGIRNERLRRMVTHAYRHVPYYRRLFDRNGIDARDIRTAADLKVVPITTKDDLRASPVADTVARGVDPRRLVEYWTGGYSGEPFTIRRTWTEQRVWSLFWLRARRYFGLRWSDRIASVHFPRHGRGHGKGFHLRLLNAAGVYRQTSIDCCRPVEEIVRVLCVYQPDFLRGYSGALSAVAACLAEDDKRRVRPRAVRVGGEVLTEQMRERISHAFRAPVYNIYGSHELNIIAWECKETGELHTSDDSVIVEILKDGREVAPGEEGELVGTNLHSFAMPFIRYRLGDIVTKGSQPCPCGQPFSTIRRVQGRMIDYFTLPDRRSLHPYQILGSVRDSANWIRRYQMIQEREDRIILRVVPFGEPHGEEVRQLEKSVAASFGPRVEFSLRLVREIQPEAGGKFRVARSLVKSRPHGGERD